MNVQQKLIDAPEVEPVAFMTREGLVASRKQVETNTASSLAASFTIPLYTAPQPPSVPELEEYDAGVLNDFGGGNVGWWQDYIRSELGRAYEFYCGQLSAAPTPAEAPAPKSESIAYIEHHKGGDNLVWDNPGGKYSVLYTAPLVMKLSDERILEIATRFQDGGDFGWDTNMCEMEQLGFARAIERELLGE